MASTWPGLLAVVIALSAWLPSAAVETLRYERHALAAGEWWRLVSAHFVHLGPAHALLNAGALLLIVWLAPPVRGPVSGPCVLLAAAVAVDAGLYWLAPGVGWYVGASGALHGLFAGGAILVIARGDRLVGLAMLVALVAKLGWEMTGGGSLSGVDFPVVSESHLFGAVGGLLGALLMLIGSRAGLASISEATNGR